MKLSFLHFSPKTITGTQWLSYSKILSEKGAICLSLWGFGLKLTIHTGILKTPSRYNLDTSTWYMNLFQHWVFNSTLWPGAAVTRHSYRLKGINIKRPFPRTPRILNLKNPVTLQYRFMGILNNLIMPFHIYWNIRSNFLFVSHHNML